MKLTHNKLLLNFFRIIIMLVILTMVYANIKRQWDLAHNLSMLLYLLIVIAGYYFTRQLVREDEQVRKEFSDIMNDD